MTRTIFFRVCIFICTLSLGACARVGAPTGGPKDTTPPRVVESASTPNLSTRFSARSFELTFDEWITLQDVGAQVLVSPPLTKRPEVRLKGKTVIFELAKDEVLRPSTTYTVAFGTAVKDLHEGNPAKDLRFVFSTGDYLDSLSIRGKVVDAFSGDPVENISVLLYDQAADSVIQKERPYYYTRTDKTGQFRVQNVRAGWFRIVGIDDADQNLRWSGASERLAFVDSMLDVQPALADTAITLRLYQERDQPRIIERVTDRFGLVRLVFSAPPDSVPLLPNVPGIRLLPERLADTLLVWYHQEAPGGNWKLVAGKDTINVRPPAREEYFKTYRLNFGDAAPLSPAKPSKFQPTPPPPVPTGPRTQTVNPAKPAVLAFNSPLIAWDTSKWQLYVDSQQVHAYQLVFDSTKPRQLRLSTVWKPERPYRLELLPGALTDLFGSSNADTLRRNLPVLGEKQFGALSLKIQRLTVGQRYIVQLVNGNVIEEERSFTATADEERLAFPGLPTAVYTVRLIFDDNGNGRWDGGRYWKRVQPERIISKSLEALRANWELETELRIGWK